MMPQVARDTDATMEHAIDFLDFYRRSVRLPEVTEREIVFYDPSGRRISIAVKVSGKIDAEGVEEKWWSLEDIAVSSENRLIQWPYPEAEPESWRGIFSLTYHRTILFSESIEIQTAKLPRLKPHVILNRRMLSREEDD